MHLSQRSEIGVWSDLQALAREPGFIHAMASICLRDNAIVFKGDVTADDMQPMYTHKRLTRSEQTTLLGLMVQKPMDWCEPSATALESMITRADALMAELHQALVAPMRHHLMEDEDPTESATPGAVIREAAFYAGESAYSFQYREFAYERYLQDDAWLNQNKGYSVEDARSISKAMCALLDERTTASFRAQRPDHQASNLLRNFELSASELASRTGLPLENVQAFLRAFTLMGTNAQFQNLSDYNALAGTPLIPTPEGNVLLFQHYAIYESVYDSPFYWMIKDDAYKAEASAHRGAFTENLVARRLAAVFGAKHVHKNVRIHRKKGLEPGEIDVLVIHGDRLIVVQAKAKRLTLQARAGNDGAIAKDFASAIQISYDQAKVCADEICAGSELKDEAGQSIALPSKPKEIFIFNVVSDHYPSLAFQARAFLKYAETEVIRAPYVMDVFLLDAMTEMLNTPLKLLCYVGLRIATIGKLVLSHEHTALSYHLRRNLWLDDDFHRLLLEEDITAHLDAAMLVRRESFPGERTPDGILTRMAGTMFEVLVRQFEFEPNAAAIEIGLHLLQLNEDAAQTIHEGLAALTEWTRRDGKRHDLSVGSKDHGITFHCNPSFTTENRDFLMAHCESRKYATKSSKWMGVSLSPDGKVQFAGVVAFPWTSSEDMERATAGMGVGIPARRLSSVVRSSRPGKLGRNEPCPCGSGLKYKKCCLLA